MIRYYSFVTFLGLLSCLFFLQLLGRWRVSSYAAYLAVSALLIYTDYSAWSLLIAQNLLLVFIWKKHRAFLPRWALSQLLLLVLFLPWLSVVVGHAAKGKVEADFARGALGYLLKVAYPFYSFAVGETLFPWHPVALLGCAVVIGLFVGGLVVLCRGSRPAGPILFLFIPLAFTIFLLSAVATDITFLNVASRTLFAAPFFYMIVAEGLLWVGDTRWQTILLIVVTIVSGYSLCNYYANQQFHDPIYVIPAREMAAQVARSSQPGDVIVSDWDSAFSYYYSKLDEPTAHFWSQSWEGAQDHIQTHDSPRVWLITIGRDRTRAMAPVAFVEWLMEDYELTSTWGYAEQDEMYRRVKEMLLRRPAYRYKAMLQLYTRRQR